MKLPTKDVVRVLGAATSDDQERVAAHLQLEDGSDIWLSFPPDTARDLMARLTREMPEPPLHERLVHGAASVEARPYVKAEIETGLIAFVFGLSDGRIYEFGAEREAAEEIANGLKQILQQPTPGKASH